MQNSVCLCVDSKPKVLHIKLRFIDDMKASGIKTLLHGASASRASLLCVCLCWLQFSLLSEVRGLVSPQDLERFDALVLRREIEALKARQGAAGAAALHSDSFSMVSYPDTLASSASYMTNTTLSSARVRV